MTHSPRQTDPEPYLVTAEQPTFNALFFGDSGVGKTTLACSAQDHPEMKNVLVANIEGGLLSVAHRGDIHAEDIRSTDELRRLGWRLAQGEFPSVRTVVIDNVTELQMLNLREVVRAAIAGGRNRVKNRDRTEDDIWMEDYKTCTMQLSGIFQMFRDLPMNTIFTAHAKRVYPKVPDTTDLTKLDPIAVVPSLSQQLMERTMSYVDFAWCLEVDEDSAEHKRLLVTTSRGIYRCKTRGPKFLAAIGDIVESPTMAALYDTFVASAHAPTKKSRTR